MCNWLDGKTGGISNVQHCIVDSITKNACELNVASIAHILTKTTSCTHTQRGLKKMKMLELFLYG